MEIGKKSGSFAANRSSNDNNTGKKKSLIDNLSILNEFENIFIIDLFYICAEKCDRSDLDMIKYFDVAKEYSIYDDKTTYIFFHSNKQLELIENTKSLNEKFNHNIFLEDKIVNIGFISGFCVAKSIPVYLFSDGMSHLGSWLRTQDAVYKNKIKVSELDYLRITLDYLLKDKKRKYEQANKSKLAKILSDSMQIKSQQTTTNDSEANKTSNVTAQTYLKSLTSNKKDLNSMKNTNLSKNIKNNNTHMHNKNSNFINNNQYANNTTSTNQAQNFTIGNNKEQVNFTSKKRTLASANPQNNINNNTNNLSNKPNIKDNQIPASNAKPRQAEIEDYLQSYKFSNFLTKIKNYIQANPPKNFEVLKNIIYHFTEQNFISINSYLKDNLESSGGSNQAESLKPEELSFFILKELLKREIILNKNFYELINNSKIVNNLEEISNLLNFHINLNSASNSSEKSLEAETEGDNPAANNNSNSQGENQRNLIYVTSNCENKKKFIIEEQTKEEYKNLILNCETICNFVKNVICKILNSLNISSLEKLPTNPFKYRNYIFSFLNNQELFKISKKILNSDYNHLLNVLTEGIISELMNNNLIVFINDKKIHYNLPEIEKEKFRLNKFKNNIQTTNTVTNSAICNDALTISTTADNNQEASCSRNASEIPAV